MGIRGLTTFIATNYKDYLEDYQLQDTYLVIDGYNIASHLYIWHCTRNDCFGGDYDKYAKVVYKFFKLLETCSVIPVILFDGAYEDKKLKTVYSRLKGKIKTAKYLNSVTQGGTTMFPLFLRDVFIDIVLTLGLKALQCDFEADYEMACVAKSLNCPVLSYDSDFYIFDVLYIPFSTFDLNIHKLKGSSLYFIACKMYKIDKFLQNVGGLRKENLPLMATLLGNDYVKISVFQQFYSQLKLPKNQKGRSNQQGRILGVIRWLQTETYDSAVTKILSKLKITDRRTVAEHIKIASDIYLNMKSEVLCYLNINVSPRIENSFIFDPEEYLQKASNYVEENNEDIFSDSEESDGNDTDEFHDHSALKTSNNIPDWFTEKCRRCEYPQAFLNIICRNMYLCTPQIEDYDNVCSHNISFPIISAIHKVLSSGLKGNITCAIRTDRSARVSNVKVTSCNKILPQLSDISFIKPADAKRMLFDILDLSCTDDFEEFLNVLPTSWKLYFVAIIYWTQHTSNKVSYSHVYSLILCLFVLNKVDPQIGFYRSTSKFTVKYAAKINALVNNYKTTSDSNVDFSELLNNINDTECLLGFKELLTFFQMDHKMRSNLKLFDIRILDCFAQFQSCLMHIKYLNLLLNKPFGNCTVSEFYDGTFLFNMCLNLSKRTDIHAYLRQTLLKYSPNFLNCVQRIVEYVVKIVPDNSLGVNNNNKRRRRKKKVSSTIDTDANLDIEQNSEDEALVDVNNRFSLLSVIK